MWCLLSTTSNAAINIFVPVIWFTCAHISCYCFATSFKETQLVVIKHDCSCGQSCKEELHFRREKGGSWLILFSCFYQSKFTWSYSTALPDGFLWPSGRSLVWISSKSGCGQVTRCSLGLSERESGQWGYLKAYKVCVTIKDIHIHCWWNTELVQLPQENIWHYLIKLKMYISYNLSVLLLGSYLLEVCAHVNQITGTKMFIATLFVVVKSCK